MNKKYVCPKCGSQLKVWQERIYYRESKVNPYTGKLNKTINNTKHEDNIGMCGFECINEEGGFVINSVSETSRMDKYKYLYDIDIDSIQEE